MTCGGKIKAPLTGHIDPQMRNRGAFLAHPHTVPEQKLNISKKMTAKGTSTFPPELGLFTYQIS